MRPALEDAVTSSDATRVAQVAPARMHPAHLVPHEWRIPVIRQRPPVDSAGTPSLRPRSTSSTPPRGSAPLPRHTKHDGVPSGAAAGHADPVRTRLEDLIDEHRAALHDSLDGLTEEEARRSLVPSRTTRSVLSRSRRLSR